MHVPEFKWLLIIILEELMGVNGKSSEGRWKTWFLCRLMRWMFIDHEIRVVQSFIEMFNNLTLSTLDVF